MNTMGIIDKIRWFLLPSWARRLISKWKSMDRVVDVRYSYHDGVLELEIITVSGYRIRDRCIGRGIMLICTSRAEQITELW